MSLYVCFLDQLGRHPGEFLLEGLLFGIFQFVERDGILLHEIIEHVFGIEAGQLPEVVRHLYLTDVTDDIVQPGLRDISRQDGHEVLHLFTVMCRRINSGARTLSRPFLREPGILALDEDPGPGRQIHRGNRPYHDPFADVILDRR